MFAPVINRGFSLLKFSWMLLFLIMTILPTRDTISAIGQTYGQVRAALGDLRDTIAEAIGTSGTAPVMNNATLTSAVSIGVRVANPGADFQVFGSGAFTASSAAASNPGDGSLHLDGRLRFASPSGLKLDFSAASGDPIGVGKQNNNSMYLRTRSSWTIYLNGIHSDTQFDAGTNGSELLRVSDTEFKYKGQTIYHSGNGVFLRKDQADTAQGKITLNAGARVVASDLEIGDGTTATNYLKFINNSVGDKIQLFPFQSVYTLGVQNSTIYLRTNGKFAVYSGGSFVDQTPPAPGTGGETLLYADSNNNFTYRGNTIFHSGNSNFVGKENNNYNGVNKLYNHDFAANRYIRFVNNLWGDGRYGLQGINENGQPVETRVEYASIANNAWNSAASGNPVVSWTSNNRQGVVRIYPENLDDSNYITPNREGTSFRWAASNGGNVIVNYADNAGYATTAGSVNSVWGGNISPNSTGVSRLSRAQASAVDTTVFGVHQYAFGSPIVKTYNFNPNNLRWLAPASNQSSTEQRVWAIYTWSGTTVAYVGNNYVVWDYLTGSGEPRTYVVADAQGNILNTWDAEDPINPNDPDEKPVIGVGEEGRIIEPIQIFYPKTDDLMTLMETFLNNTVDLGNQSARMKKFLANAANPNKALKKLLRHYTKERGHGMDDFNEDMDLREFIQDLGSSDSEKKAWRKQAILRSMARLIDPNDDINMGLLLKRLYRVNRKLGTLELK